MKSFTIASATLLTMLFSLTSYAGNTKDKPLLNDIVATINLDIDKDQKVDTAHLVKSDNTDSGDLDLWVLLSSDPPYYRVKKIAYDMNGGAAGMGTELKLNSAGSLQIYSYNDAIGRNRWESTMTFAYRGRTLVLAGYTISQRDTLDLTSSTCDVNMLTKKGTYDSNKGSKTFDVNSSDVKPINVLSLNYIEMDFIPKYCAEEDFNENDTF